jgi:iron complex transport system substrate-binding protein
VEPDVSALPPTIQRPQPRPRFAILVASLAIVLSACTSGASTPPASIPPGATGSLIAPATATPAPSPSAAPFPVTLTDDEGTAVELTAAPEQIVSLTPATTEILYTLGAADRMVGKVEDPANFPPEAKNVPVVGTFNTVDVEKIVGLGTDLVIAGGNNGTPPDSITKLRSLKIPVLVVYARDVDGVFKDIQLTGRAVGKGAEANDLVASMQSGFRGVDGLTKPVTKPRVFYETGDVPAIYGVADDSFVASMIRLAGGEPITTGSSTDWAQSIEKLVQADPEVIVLGDAAYGVTAAAVAKRSGWAGMTAVKSSSIRAVDDIVVTRPGPRLLDGLYALVKAIHPELAVPSAAPAASASAVA